MNIATIKSTCPAILFLVFNRPETTTKVFEAIRMAQPAKLYLAADGPRSNNKGEQCSVAEVRRIVSQVDWPCKTQMLFRDENLGCKHAVSSAIDWFFDQEEEGIILEDDCLPSPNFFNYCAQLLEKYRNDERVGIITGTSLCNLRKRRMTWGEEDYVFARYASIWGWASWRRVWKDYDVSMTHWHARRADIMDLTKNEKLAKLNANIFDRVHGGEIDTWDYQVTYMLWNTNRLAIIPVDNLIENIGFGPAATHTKNADSAISDMSRMGNEIFSNPLKSPSLMLQNFKYNKYIEEFSTRSLFLKIVESAKRRISSIFVCD